MLASKQLLRLPSVTVSRHYPGNPRTTVRPRFVPFRLSDAAWATSHACCEAEASIRQAAVPWLNAISGPPRGIPCPSANVRLPALQPFLPSRAHSRSRPAATNREVESNGGVPGDWVEVVNLGPGNVDLSGWSFRDNDDTHVYTFPVGTVIAANTYLAFGEPEMRFGQVVLEGWPGANATSDADALNQFGDNLSGLTYQPPLGTFQTP